MNKKAETTQSFMEYVQTVKRDARLSKNYESLDRPGDNTSERDTRDQGLVRNPQSHSAFSAYHG
jgi:hypothetical protein